MKDETPAEHTLSAHMKHIAVNAEQLDILSKVQDCTAMQIAQGSVEDLIKLGKGFDVDQAQTLHQRASSVAVLAARQMREQRLKASEPASAAMARSGVRALVDGPSFESQFTPSWSSNCMPGAIEATTSPAAYLTSLYRLATQTIEPLAIEGEAITLAERRPDLVDLTLDPVSLERVEPTVVVVNEILERAAREFLDSRNRSDEAVDDVLLTTRYPFQLPYERYQAQINHVLQRKRYQLGDAVRQLDPKFPYFKEQGLHSAASDDALQLDTAFGPEQRALLLEAPYFPLTNLARKAPGLQRQAAMAMAQTGFYNRHYGVADAEPLVDIATFCKRTGINQTQLEDLLSIETRAPVASPNVAGLAPASPAVFGSSYVNAGIAPTLGVASEGGSMHRFTGHTDGHFDRLQRIIRLSRWMELSFADTDLLLAAAFKSECGENPHGFQITENTLRMLGLFRQLQRDFKVTAEDFAALVHGVGLYACGSDIPQFDRIFNASGLFETPLCLDDSVFPIVPATDNQYRKVDHLCSALGISFETYVYVARYIAQGLHRQNSESQADADVNSLRWSHAVVSAFYRLVKLPRYLGISSIEAIALLQLINQSANQYVSRLAQPRLAVYQHSEMTDTLSVIQSLADVIKWCNTHQLSVNWLYQQVMPLTPVAAATEHEIDLLKQIQSRMGAVLVSQATFVEAGAPQYSAGDAPTAIDWLAEFEAFVSGDGLIIDRSIMAPEYEDEAYYTERLLELIDRVMSRHGVTAISDLRIKLFSVVMDARAAQQSLVWECLASTLKVTAEQCRELLLWARGTTYQLLAEVLRVFAIEGGAGVAVPVGDEVLTILARLARRAAIAQQLNVSAMALRSFVRNPEWFGRPAQVRRTRSATWLIDDIGFADLYSLVQYQRVVKFSRRGEQELLDYLQLVNSLPNELSDADAELVREDAAGKIAGFIGFGTRDILQTAALLTDNGILLTVLELDHLIRIREFCNALQLGTTAVVDLSRLRSDSSRNDYRAAGEGALASLTASLSGEGKQVEGELGQSESSWIIVDRELLVARTDEVARFTITVRNFLGQPMGGIRVVWRTSLGELQLPAMTETDANGEMTVTLMAGDEMGTAQVTATYGLDRQIQAPLVRIDCDESTLDFIEVPHYPNPAEALAGDREEIEFAVELVDMHGNVGRDRVVQWETDLGQFLRPQTRTDSEGLAYATLHSQPSGAATVVASFEVNGNEHEFQPVSFLEQPYFQYVKFSSSIASTLPSEAICRIVNLDGSPVVGATVNWTATVGGFDGGNSSLTDVEGIARILYLSNVPGTVTVGVAATVAGVPLRAMYSAPTVIHELPQISDFAPAHQYFRVTQSAMASFSVSLEPAMARYPVTWLVDGAVHSTTYTNTDGKAKFAKRFTGSELGTHTVVAQTVGEGNEAIFDVSVVAAHDTLVFDRTLSSQAILNHPTVETFTLSKGHAGDLQVTATGPAGPDDGAWVILSVDNAEDLERMGVVFTPLLGEKLYTDEQGVASVHIDARSAAFLPNDLNDNTVRLTARSNLSVTQTVELRLREVVEVSDIDMGSAYVSANPRICYMYGHIHNAFDAALADGLPDMKIFLSYGPKSIDAVLKPDAYGATFVATYQSNDNFNRGRIVVADNPRIIFASGTDTVFSVDRPITLRGGIDSSGIAVQALTPNVRMGDDQKLYIPRGERGRIKVRAVLGTTPLMSMDCSCVWQSPWPLGVNAITSATDRYGYQEIELDATNVSIEDERSIYFGFTQVGDVRRLCGYVRQEIE